MRIWLITVGEPLPTDAQNVRLLRTGILADLLARGGDEVVWWSSTFDHVKKTLRFASRVSLDVENYRLELLHGRPYKSNVSLARILNHREIAEQFRDRAAELDKPDVILCSFPTIELSRAAIEYGKEHGVPVVLDVRDLWPDIFVDLAPKPLRWLVKKALFGMFSQTEAAFRGCESVVGISQTYLSWGLSYAHRAASPRDRIVPLGYHEGHFDSKTLEVARGKLRALGVREDRLLCCFIGVFGKTYDLETPIRAAKELARSGRAGQFQFVFCGQGEKGPEWRRLAEGLDDVLFAGWLNGAEIRALTGMAQVGLAAYTDKAPQSLPNKIFEYLSAGLPVLSSLGGETQLLLSDNGCGLTYQAGDPASFLVALETLRDADVRQQMGQRSRMLYEKRFSSEKVYREMRDHLHAMASPAHSC